MADQQTVANADLQLDAVAGRLVAARTTQVVCLHTGRVPTSGNEVTGNAYARQAMANTAWNKSTVGGYRRLSNSAAIQFPDPTGAGWATANGSIALWDRPPADAGAVLLFHADVEVNFEAGDPVEWAIGSFSYAIKLVE